MCMLPGSGQLARAIVDMRQQSKQYKPFPHEINTKSTKLAQCTHTSIHTCAQTAQTVIVKWRVSEG